MSVQQDARVEVARRVIDAWNRRDLEAVLALCDPEIEYVNAPDAVEPGTRRGLEEAAGVLRAQWDILGDAWMTVEALHPVGDYVLAIMRMSRPMPGSDIRLEGRFAARYTIHGGKVTRIEAFGDDIEGALADAGISG